MNNKALVVEKTLHAPVERVWKAITDNNDMKNWYFNLPEFRPEVGFEFTFTGGPDGGPQYKHTCVITDVQERKKLSYSWRFDGYEGDSEVSFELFPEGEHTRVVITHSGLESFPASNPDFAAKNFEQGWTEILDTHLRKFVEA